MQGNWIKVWKSKTIYEHRMNATGGQVDFRYPQQTLSEVDLCNCEQHAKLRFVLRDEEDNDLNVVNTSIIDLIKHSKEKVKRGDVSFQIEAEQEGTVLIFETFNEWEKPWFSEFLASGWELGVTTAIDFTASNGNPEHADSYHYINTEDPEALN